MLSPEDRQQVDSMIRTILATDIVQKKVGDTPLEAYDLVNKKYADSQGGVSASGVGSNASIAGSNVPTLVGLASSTFANGITFQAGGGYKIVTAGQYLVIGLVYYTNPGTAAVRSTIFVNGAATSVTAIGNSPGSGFIQTPVAVGIITVNAGDNVQLYGETSAAGGATATGTNSYLALTKV